jgi:hypothetical protein
MCEGSFYVVPHQPFGRCRSYVRQNFRYSDRACAKQRIGLMAANIDQHFLAAGLVDEIRIHPV